MSEQTLLDVALEGVDLTKLEPIDRLMIEAANRRSRQQEKERQRLARVGELNTRLIFLNAAGSVPPHLKEVVQSVLLPLDPVVKEPEEVKDSG